MSAAPVAAQAAGAVLVAGGAAFMLAATVAVLRLPDALSRLHGVAKAETAGLALMLAGAAVSAWSPRLALSALAVWIATAAAGAAAAHLIAAAERDKADAADAAQADAAHADGGHADGEHADGGRDPSARPKRDDAR